MDFCTKCARKTVFGNELSAGTGTEAVELSLRWSNLLNRLSDNWLMFSGSTALDLNVPRMLEVFLKVERVVEMFLGSV